MANVIINRVKEFLKRFPPFSFLTESTLDFVAAQVELKYFAKDEYVFRTGDPSKEYFFVLKEGAVILSEDQDETSRVIEHCDEGDVFGVRPLLGKRPYMLNALAKENSLVYMIPVEVLEKILNENSRVSTYFAKGFASGQLVVRTDLLEASSLLAENSRENGLMIFSSQSDINYSPDVLTCHLTETVGDTTKKMSDRKVGSIVIVDNNNFPKGIVTDKDLRNRVIADGKSLSTPISEVMSSPVFTMERDTNFTSIYLFMIKKRIHHLVFTEDGTDQSKVVGIVSDHDLLLSQGNNPAVLIKSLRNSKNVDELVRLRNQAEQLLKYYLENEVSINFSSGIISEINDIIIQRAIWLAKRKHDPNFEDVKDAKFCFLSLGSEGREEQLLRTDLDNAIVFEDVPQDKEERVHEYLHNIAQEVIEILVTCGYQTCPADIMANNPKWCQPLSVWKRYFGNWIRTPDEKALLNASIFFDFRPVYGTKSLADDLSEFISNLIDQKTLFLNFLAKNALSNSPPLGFFRNFLVEKSGNHKDKFDIKLRAMMPLVDAARLLILSHNIKGINNTLKRFDKLAELESNQPEIFREAGKAYEIFMRIRTIQGLNAGNSGRYIEPESLGKLQRKILKSAFYPIDEIQKIIRVRFQVDLLGT